MIADDLVRDFARRHHGLIDRGTARDFGLSDRQMQYRVSCGAWIRHWPKVFSLVGAPRTPLQRLLAATWSTGGSASHQSSGWISGLLDDPPAVPHVAVTPSARHAHPGIAVHRTQDLERVDLTSVQGIACTSIDRTVLDLCAALDDAAARQAIDRALRLGLTRPDRLTGRHIALSRRGRPGAGRARRLLVDLDPDLARMESDLESLLLRLVRAAGLPAPVPQYRVEVAGHRYRIDLCYPDRMVAIEGDGFGVHGTRSAFETDRSRQNDLVLAGWRILRFTWRQISREPDWVVEQIRTALAISS